MNLKELILISRPRFWLYLTGPFLIGYAAGMSDITDLLNPVFWIFFLYFLFPANLFLYGINDIADQDTDKFNTKKDQYERKLQEKNIKYLRGSLVLHSILTVLLAILLFTPGQAFLLLFLWFLSFAYSSKPFRFKARPVLDSASNLLYIVPGIFAYFLTTQQIPPWWVITAGWFWAAAMHLFSAIPDIKADSKAGLKTTAVVLGEKGGLLMCSLLWFISALTAFYYANVLWVVPFFLYCLVPLIIVYRKINVMVAYKYFPYLNAMLGFYLFWVIVLIRFYL